MSAKTEIRSIIDGAKREQQRRSEAQATESAQHAAELAEQSRKGAAWLSTHVVPVVLELKQELVAEAIDIEIEENLAPHISAGHFDGPSLAIQLVGKTPAGGAPARSGHYLFHCDGEFLNISVDRDKARSPLGMPFAIDSNPAEADAIVLEIVRRAVTDYYERA
jgi:hypothetical protein